MLVRLTLAYRGTAYAGWQRQANALAVQEVVERALGDLAGAPVTLHGASRTDAGVHAHGQVAHFELEREVPLRGWVHGTNHRLPADIRVLDAELQPPGFHARFSALGKEYRYRLSRARVLTPFEAPYTVRLDAACAMAPLREATAALVGRHDFAAFALAGGSHRDPMRTIAAAEWLEDGATLAFRIVGDGFLRGMVRGLVGTLLEVGAGRRAPESFTALLSGPAGAAAAPPLYRRAAAGPTAPARGLVLERVIYPEGSVLVRTLPA